MNKDQIHDILEAQEQKRNKVNSFGARCHNAGYANGAADMYIKLGVWLKAVLSDGRYYDNSSFNMKAFLEDLEIRAVQEDYHDWQNVQDLKGINSKSVRTISMRELEKAATEAADKVQATKEWKQLHDLLSLNPGMEEVINDLILEELRNDTRADI
jgi:hypothetical protein